MQLDTHEGSVSGLPLLQVMLQLIHRHATELQRVIGVVQHALVVVHVEGAGVVEGLGVVVPRRWEPERLQQFVGHGVGAVSLWMGGDNGKVRFCSVCLQLGFSYGRESLFVSVLSCSSLLNPCLVVAFSLSVCLCVSVCVSVCDFCGDDPL